MVHAVSHRNKTAPFAAFFKEYQTLPDKWPQALIIFVLLTELILFFQTNIMELDFLEKDS